MGLFYGDSALPLDHLKVEVNGPQKVSPDISTTEEVGIVQIMYRVTVPGDYEITGYVSGDELFHMKTTVKDINERGRTRQNQEQAKEEEPRMKLSEWGSIRRVKAKSTKPEDDAANHDNETKVEVKEITTTLDQSAKLSRDSHDSKVPEQNLKKEETPIQTLFQPLDKDTLLKKISNDPEKQLRMEKIKAMKDQDKEFKLQRRETQRAQELEILYQMKQWDDLFQEVEHSQQQVMKSQNILEIIEEDTENWVKILQSNSSESISDISEKIKKDTEKWDNLVKSMEGRSLGSKASQRTLSMAKRHVEKIKKDIQESIPVVKNVVANDESKMKLVRKVTVQNSETQRKIQNLQKQQPKISNEVAKEEKVTDLSELIKSIEEWKNVLEIPEWTPRVSLAKIKEIQRRIYEDHKDWGDEFSVTEFIGGENNTKLKDIGSKIEKERDDWNYLVDQVEVVDIALTRVREILQSIEEFDNDTLHITAKDQSFQKIKNQIQVWVDLLKKAQYLKDKIKLLILEEEGDWKKITTMLKEFKEPVKSSDILSKIKKDVLNWNPVYQMISDMEKLNWFSVAEVTEMIENAENWLEITGNKEKEDIIVKPPALQEIEGEAINNQEVPQEVLIRNPQESHYQEEIKRLNQMVATLTSQLAALTSK